jgi:hypothetical protein
VIINSQAGVGAENADCFSYWSASTFSGDQFSQAAIPTIGYYTSVIVRADSTQDRFYFGFVSATNTYGIAVRWDGSYATLAAGSAETWQAGDTLTLEVAGSGNAITLSMYHNGRSVLTWRSGSSSYVKAGGSPGLGVWSQSGQGLTLGNWTGGNLAQVLTVAGLRAQNKVYDGTTAATLILSNAVLVGVASGDTVTLNTNNAVGAFADKNVGAGKLVTVGGLALAGADAGKYTLMQPPTNADITASPAPTILSIVRSPDNTNVTITWTSVSNSVYRVQYKTSLASASWLNLAPDVTATGSNASLSDHPGTVSQRSYRTVLP